VRETDGRIVLREVVLERKTAVGSDERERDDFVEREGSIERSKGECLESEETDIHQAGSSYMEMG
jgi:hypothetical protein